MQRGRTLNVVLGALLGAVVLHERLSLARLAGLVTIIAGVLLTCVQGRLKF
ncbi:hypothetical protein AB0E63_19175 [Kribbella sp. NPDC026596]|uniref:hypothetical protein n=1 Tax=Kribbella sp. NPDC026596 TaxID=3155122 RepID=UPI0033CF3C44